MSILITSDLPEKCSLSEIYQSTKLCMALAIKEQEDSFKRITPFVTCRDFLTDVYTYSTIKKKFGIYGMEFNPTKNIPDSSGVYLILDFPKKETQGIFTDQLQYLQEVEKNNRMQIFTLHVLSPLRCLSIGDVKWTQNCLLFSLYSLLIRSLCSKMEQGNTWIEALGKVKGNSDATLLASVATPTWERILGNLQSIETDSFCGYDPALAPIQAIHHNSGFISVFGNHREIDFNVVAKKNMHWRIMKERGFELYPATLSAFNK